MKKIENLENLRVFCEIVETGSAREACEKLHIEPSNAFRIIRAMEKELKSKFFDRSQRPMKLTPEGKRYYSYVFRILQLEEELEEELTDSADSLTGPIHVASTAGFRESLIVPSAVEFQMKHPGISIEVKDMVSGVSEFLTTPDNESNDIVFMYRPSDELPEGAILRDCGPMHFIACASPAYLTQQGEPERPSDCMRHTGLLLRLPNRTSVSYLSKNGVTEKLDWKQTIAFTSQVNARDALLLGAGIVPDMAFDQCVDYLKDGRIVPVMRGWTRPPRHCCVITTEKALRKKRVRLFADWLTVRATKYTDEMNKAFFSFPRKGL